VTLPLADIDSVFALPPGRSRLVPAAAAAAAVLSMAGIWAWSD
jgi:hypothetical protein